MKEILKHSIRKYEAEKNIEIEKLRQKFIEPIEPKSSFKKMIENEIFIPSQRIIPHKTEIKQERPKLKIYRFNEPIKREPIIHRIKIERQKPPQKIKRLVKPKQVQKPGMPKIQDITEIHPVARPRPEGFSLGRLEPLIKDPSIQSIECLGPNKNILVKRYNKTNSTRIILNQTEITSIINLFSTQAKIPVTGGILKAAVGNLIISAVISEFIGSKFIINKISPYSLINTSD